MPRLQLKTKPHSSATGIYDNSVFETGRITLNGDPNGIGIFIGSTEALSITGVYTEGVTYNTAALMVAGGAMIDDHLYVDAGISTNGDIQIGMTGSEEQILSLGLPFDDKAWRMYKLDETIRWEKYDTASQQWELMIRFSKC
jgi:hypothetical protein